MAPHTHPLESNPEPDREPSVFIGAPDLGRESGAGDKSNSVFIGAPEFDGGD